MISDSGAGSRRGADTGPGVTAAAYAALTLAGAVQALVGSFFFDSGPGIVAALAFDALILLTCVLGAWGMRSALGGVLPAAGWFVVTLLLTSVSGDGSVIVTNTPAGQWFLFGGALCAAAGALVAAAVWSRGARQRRGG